MTSTSDHSQAEVSANRRPPAADFPVPSFAEIALLGLVIAVFVVTAIALIRQGSPLGHDESVYSLRARQFVTGTTPISYWRPYRAPGLPAILQIAWLGPATEPYLRLIIAGFGTSLIAATWVVGRLLGGIRVGLIAAGGVAVTPTILLATTQVWPDVPGAALGMVTLAAYAWSVSRERVSRWVLLVPILALVATAVRFGAPLPIAIGLIALTLWRWRTVADSWRLVSTTAGLTLAAVVAVLFNPSVTAWAQTAGESTSPYSAIAALKSTNGFPWYRGLQDYWDVRSFVTGGAAGFMLTLGLLTGVIFAIRREDCRREFWVALGTGIATVGAIALVLHGEPRYLSPTFPWLWIAAAFGLAAASRIWTRDLSVAVAVTVLILIPIDSYDRSGIQNEVNGDRHQMVKDGAIAIDAATTDYSCSVITGDTAIVGWYSKCPTNRYDTNRVVVDHPAFPEGLRFLFLIEGGERQPEGDVLEEYLETTKGIVISVGEADVGRRRYVEVYEVEQ